MHEGTLFGTNRCSPGGQKVLPGGKTTLGGGREDRSDLQVSGVGELEVKLRPRHCGQRQNLPGEEELHGRT